jgi:electron transfer flavoprotein alpha subunit
VIAVVPVRDGSLPLGADEAIAEAGGRAAIVGERATDAAESARAAREVLAFEAGTYRPTAWARALAGRLSDERIVLLPHVPDGRDLAPRLALALGRPVLATATAVDEERATLIRFGGLAMEDVRIVEPVVATLQPGVRGVRAAELPTEPPRIESATLELAAAPDPETLELVAADPAAIDLAEAPRVLAGGQGLGGPDSFEHLAAVCQLVGASLGATRVATDEGWAPFERQIGTTGVAIDPDLYVAFGISGAVQHTAGLGQPRHIVSVNLDQGCPMMEMADLAIVSDARLLIAELRARLEALQERTAEEPARA